jgi:hypothetical protein
MPDKATLLGLAESVAAKDLETAYGPAEDQDALKKQALQFTQTEKILRELMSPTNHGGPKPYASTIKMKEAVHTADFKILFPRIVQDTLQLPREPIYIGQNLLARTINVDGARIMEFPTLGAIRAFELGDTQEPPEQDPSFSKNITEIRTRRFGLKLELSNDVINESQWDVLALYTQAAGNAMRRKKEELIFNEYTSRAVNIFDNSSTDQLKWTAGRGSNGTTKNATFDHLDLLDMMAALGTNGYVPTDVILHPLAWAIWAKDPILRYQLLHSGAVGQSNLGMFGQDPGTMSTYVPFGLNVVVSPFQDIAYQTTLSTGMGAVNSVASGTADFTTITVVDRNASVLILQRTPMQMVQWENPVRDIQSLMFHERYGLSVLNGGRSAVTAKNIRIDLNFNPLYTLRTVTAA